MNGKEPRYICLDTRVFRAIQRMKTREKLEFYDQLFKDFEHISTGFPQKELPDSLIGDFNRDARETMIEGYNAYMKRVFANPSGKPKEEKEQPNGGANGYPNKSIKHKSIKDNLNQSIKTNLLAEGFTESEIDGAMNQIKDGAEITNPLAYLRAVIEKKRRSEKVKAQEYQQRDYSQDTENPDSVLDRLREGMR